MKNLILLLASPLLFWSCSEDSIPEEKSKSEFQFPTDASGIQFGNITLPEGTTSETFSDGAKVKFYLPEDYYYIGVVDGNIEYYSVGCYECTSSCAEGCDVVKLGEQVGCSRCDTGFIDKCVGDDCNNSFTLEGGGLINFKDGIRVAKAEDYHPENEPDWDVLIQHPKIQKEIDVFLNDLWLGKDIDYDKAILVPFNVFGSVVRLYVPQNEEFKAKYNSEVSCDCTSGPSGCDHEDITVAFRKVGDKCVSNGCETCQMSF